MYPLIQQIVIECVSFDAVVCPKHQDTVDRMSCPQRTSVLVELTCVVANVYLCFLATVGRRMSFIFPLPKWWETLNLYTLISFGYSLKKTELHPGPCYPTSYQQGPLRESSDSYVHWWAEHKTLPSPIWWLLRLTVVLLLASCCIFVFF